MPDQPQRPMPEEFKSDAAEEKPPPKPDQRPAAPATNPEKPREKNRGRNLKPARPPSVASRPPPDEIARMERAAGKALAAERAAQSREAAPISVDSEHGQIAPKSVTDPGPPPLSVVMITPELSPVAKVGGLADVVIGLSRALSSRGNTVEIVLPKYDRLKTDRIASLEPYYHRLWVPWFGGVIHCTVFRGLVHGQTCYFIEPVAQDRFFERGKIYGEPDDDMRFAFFCRAAMEFLHVSGRHPDIIHVHDWQTALVPVLLYEMYQHLGMRHSRVCFTIHNFRHQGFCGEPVLRATGLHRPEHFLADDRLGFMGTGLVNLMKGGIVYSNFVNTVSPTYAGEVKDRGGAFGLEGTLQIHASKFGGILNGIDHDAWDPAADPHLAAPYSAKSLDGKAKNKTALRQRLLLADNEKPIVGYIGRLDEQKGLDLVRHALFYCIDHGAQFVLLGSGADRSIDDDFLRIKYEINDNTDSHLEIGFDEDLAHLIYAGADMLVVPSRFEPCGLTQLIAMRYGTIPIVRAVGGLSDTVIDKDTSDRPLHRRNGYVFHQDDRKSIEAALARAIACYYTYPEHFRQLMLNAMAADYSWREPAWHYLDVYDFIRVK